MLTAFVYRDGRLQQNEVRERESLPSDAIWVDLLAPSADERQWVEDFYSFQLPRPDEMNEIEASARFYIDDYGPHLHSYFLFTSAEGPRNTTVAFALANGRLFSLREHEYPSFAAFKARARRQPGIGNNATSILLDIYEIKVERMADVLEQVYAEQEVLARQVLRNQVSDMQSMLSMLSKQEDLNGKIRMNLMDQQRVLSFLLRSRQLSDEQTRQLTEILRDLQSLIAHSAFLFEKVDFLLNTTLGFINIEQNKIIKIFSIAAVVFLPPTLVASIYGMNFRVLPELSWTFGYPFALLLMIAAGVAPYWYFKHRGWL